MPGPASLRLSSAYTSSKKPRDNTPCFLFAQVFWQPLKLKTLGLPATQVTHSGLRRINGLTRLWALRLPRTVSREGLRHLEGLSSLGVLDIWISAGDNGPVFDSIERLTQLRQLRVEGGGLTDEDLEHIAKAPRLESLDIRGSRVSESGLLALNGAPKLRAVSVHEPWFPAGTQERLARALAPISVSVYERRAEYASQPRTREEFLQRAAREMEGPGVAAPEREGGGSPGPRRGLYDRRPASVPEERSAIEAGARPDDRRSRPALGRPAYGTRQRGSGRGLGGGLGGGLGRGRQGAWRGHASGGAGDSGEEPHDE